MPRNFFDSRDNDTYVHDGDGDGVEFEGLEEVKINAATALAELARDVLPGSQRRELAIEVRDEMGPVLVTRLTFEAVILRQPS